MSNRILITGAPGFAGANLTRRLLEEGHRVRLLRSSAAPAPRLAGLPLTQRVVDFGDADQVQQAVVDEEPEIIYHLASTSFNPPGTAAKEHFRAIVLTAVALAEGLRQQGGGRLIAAGSAAEYGDGDCLSEQAPLRPSTILGAAKASATLVLETYARMYGIETVVLRLFTPYGPWEHPRRLTPHVILSALKGKAIRLNGGAQQRDFLYISDAVEAMRLAAAKPLPRPAVLNICSGQGTAVREMAELIVRLVGREVPIGGGGATRPDEILRSSGDGSAAAEHLGWRPATSLEEGLQKTIAWWKESPQWVHCLN
jgi:UDP-glucose 4-epimerase